MVPDPTRDDDETRDDGAPGPRVDLSDRTLLAGAGVVAVLTLLYSVVIVGQILVWFVLVIQLFVLYLLWRFVRAHERIAGAQERRARAAVSEE